MIYPLMPTISSPAVRPAFADGVPGRVCSTMTRPGNSETTVPKPFCVDDSILRSCSNWLGSKKTECGSSLPSSPGMRSEEHTSELQSLRHLVCRLLLEKKKKTL